MTEEGCEVYFPPEGADLVRASEQELTLLRLGYLEIVPETVACLIERRRTCSDEDPSTCGPLFRTVLEPMEGQPCRDDVQCGPSMRCEGPERTGFPTLDDLCRVGACVPRIADGEPCELRLRSTAERPVGPCLVDSVCVEGVCRSIAGIDPAAVGERCGFVAQGPAAVYRSCRDGQCLTTQPDNLERCVRTAAIGEACGDQPGDALCGVDAACLVEERRCVARPLPCDPCTPGDEGSWCTFEAFGTAYVDGICVPNERRLGDACAAHHVQPCAEGACVLADADATTMTCEPSLMSPAGGPCRDNDDDCLDGVGCIGTCVSLGGIR